MTFQDKTEASLVSLQVEPFLYNKGRGRYIPIANLVKLRNCDRPRHKQLPDIRILENPEEDFDIDADCPDVRSIECGSIVEVTQLSLFVSLFRFRSARLTI
jgi:hypothetical protein